MKTAIVNVTRLLDHSQRGKMLSGQLKALADKWGAQIGDCERRIEKSRQALAKAPPTLPADNLFLIQKDLRKAEIELRHAEELREFEVEAERQHLRDTVLAELDPLLAKLCQEKQIALVLTTPRADVAYAAPEVDLTDELLRLYDAATKS